MCITYFNIHNCGHTSYVDTDVCGPHLKALEITNYMDRPDDEKDANAMEVDEKFLLVMLADWRRKCIQKSGNYASRRNYKCARCLGDLLNKTGLTGDDDPVAKIGVTGI